MRRLIVLVFAAVVGLSAGVAVGGTGDWVTLHLEDGRVVTGEVIDESPDFIKVKAHVAGIAMEMEFSADEVTKIEREEAGDRTAVDGERVEQEEKGMVPEETADRGGYVVIPAEGVIGEELTTFFFRETCEQAIRADAELIVYDLESPGGYLHILWDIRQTLDSYEDQIQIAFYTDGECFSAAALLGMSSQHFYVGDDATFGAAVIWQSGSDGQPTAVDAKFASAEASKWRREAAKRGRSTVIIDALVRQEAEVWADQSTTPWTLYGGRSEGGDAALVEIDSAQSVLSMTGAEGVELGAADGRVRRAKDIAKHLEIPAWEREALDGVDAARTIRKIQQRNIFKLTNRLDQIGKNIARIDERAASGKLTESSLRREVRSLMQIGRGLLDLYDELDYARDYLHAEHGITRASIQAYVDRMNEIRKALD